MSKILYQGKYSVLLFRIIFLTALVLLFSGSCYNKCETCRKFDNQTGQKTDELTACDPAMIQNLESKGYYCR
jgi:hypothetical protein